MSQLSDIPKQQTQQINIGEEVETTEVDVEDLEPPTKVATPPTIINQSDKSDDDQISYLQLGDIIKVTSTNESSNNKIYYIKYIGSPIIKVIENISLDEFTWDFNNGIIENGEITKIVILKREETPSYARQNNFVEYAWIDIVFEDLSTVTGQISNLEEDMIEITVYPTNEIIYINFEYKGLPLNFGILEIKLTNAPPSNKKYKIVEELQPIQQILEVESKYFRYSIEEQTTDFLEVLLSKIPSTKRNDNILNSFNKLITRFTQLRSKYTLFDKNNNIISSEKPFINHTDNWKPLIKSLGDLNNKLFWLVFVGKYIKKSFVDNDVLYRDLRKINESYINNNFSPEQNPYFELYKSINQEFTPFDDIDRDDIENVLCQLPVKINIDVINNNSDDFYTQAKLFYSQRFNTEITYITQTKLVGGIAKSNFFNLMEPDLLSLKSIITLPIPVIKFSKINLSETTILERANLGQQFINYWKIMNKHTKLKNIKINDLDTPITSRFDKITNYELSSELNTELNKNSKHKKNKYFKYLNNIVPQTNTLFDLIKSTIVGKFAFKSIIDCLEPFMIYPEDITYHQYREINKYLNNSFFKTESELGQIQQYIIQNSKREAEFKKINVFNPSPDINKPGSDKEKSRPLNNLFDLITYNYTENKEKITVQEVINEYFNNNTNVKKLTNSEILKEMLEADFATLYKLQLALSTIQLNIPDDTIINIIADDKNNEALRPGENPCKNYIISKKYNTIEELEGDNGKDVFFDKLYDDINYNILSEVEEEYNKKFGIINDYRNSEEFNKFLKDKLKNKYKYNVEDIEYVVESLMNNSKRVLAGQYAIIIKSENGEPTFYIRTNESTWAIDETVPTDLMDVSALCNNQPTCVYTKQKINNTCESMDNIYKKTEKELLTEMENKYTEYNDIIKHSQSDLEEMSNLYLIKLIHRNISKVSDSINIRIGLSVKDDSPHVISPYSKILDIILSINDFVKKQQFILEFYTKCTRLPNPDNTDIITGKPEDDNWFYCKQTNIKLLPKFLYRLAYAYQFGKYNTELIKVINECGTLSDDGDKIIDKNSGKIIKYIDFVYGEEYTEEGFRIISTGVLDEEIVLPTKNIAEEVVVNKYISNESKIINNIILALSSQMKINITDHHDFIINKVSTIYTANVPSEKKYNKKMEENNRGKNPDKIDKTTYEDFTNLLLLYLTLGCFLIVVQTNIPSLKINYTFPNCVRSFSGYPIDKDDTDGGLKYISCVALKLKSNKFYPWKALPSGKDKTKLLESVIKKIKMYCDAYLIKDDDINFRIQSKQRYLLEHGEEVQENNGDHEIELWTTFLPSIRPFKIKNLVNVSEEFEKRSITHLKMGSPAQMDDVFVLKSKIIMFSFAIQELVQEVVSNEPLLMVDSLIENSCCNNISENNTLQFFIKRKSDIELHNNNVVKFSKFLNDVRLLTIAPIFSSKEITKMQTFAVPSAFNEQTIFLAIIKYCNFKNTIPISEEISAICRSKPEYINLSDTSSEIILKLKTHNQSYTEEQMIRLLQIINHNNIIKNIDTNAAIYTPKSVLLDICEKLIVDVDNIELNQLIPILEAYLHTNDIDHPTRMEEESQPLQNLDKLLVISTAAIQKEVIEFITKYAVNKNKKEKDMVIKFLNNLTNTVDSDQINIINYVKNCIKMIGKILPGMIKKKVKYDIEVNRDWNISGFHKQNILKISSEEYISIQKYYEDPDLNTGFLEYIQKMYSQIILLSDKIPIIYNSNFTPEMSMKLMRYCFFIGLYRYITSIDELELLERPEIIQLNDETNLKNIKITSLLCDFIKILSNHKEKINISYEDVMNNIFKLKESEKNRIRKRTSELSNEARKIDNEFKMLKIGEWGKGENVTGYDGERYDEEYKIMNEYNENVKKANRLLQLDEDAARQNYEEELFHGADANRPREEDGDYNNDNDDNDIDDNL